jgi:hypothetical protein
MPAERPPVPAPVWQGMSRSARLLDAGTLQIRGGSPMFDRDEQFCIETLEEGYRIHTQIVALDHSYDFCCLFEYSADWLPRAASAEGRRAGGAFEVSIVQHEGTAMLEVREQGGDSSSRELALPPGCLIDLEPSALPMWAMTRRYDRARAGVQHFQWVGRSLTRDLVLEGGRTALALLHSDGQGEDEGERFEFTEELPGVNGTPFRIDFKLATSAAGWLESFEVHAGATRVRAVRQPQALAG